MILNPPTTEKPAGHLAPASLLIASVLAGCALSLGIYSASVLPYRWQVGLYVCAFLGLAALFVLPRLPRIVFYVLIFSLSIEVGKSLFYSPFESAGIGHELRINIPVVLLLILMVVMAIKMVLQRQLFNGFPRTTIPALLFILLSALSIVKAPVIALSVFELVRMVVGFLIYFVVANYIVSERPSTLLVIGTLMASLIAQAGMGIVQHFHEGGLGLGFFGEMQVDPTGLGQLHQQISRAGGLMGHPNALAALILLLGPIAGLTSMLAPGRKLRFMALLATVLSMLALIVTYSRSAWIGLILGTGLALCYGLRRRRQLLAPKEKRRLRKGIVILALSSVLCIAFFAPSIRRRLLLDDYGSAQSRVPMMIDAVEVIKDNYLLGVGLNNYPQVVLRYDVTGIHREWEATTVHNIYLLIAAETGIFSLAVFLLFLARVFRKAGRYAWLSNGPLDAALVLGATMGVACFLISWLMDPAYRFYPGLQRAFWFLLGVIVAYTRPIPHAANSTQNRAANSANGLAEGICHR